MKKAIVASAISLSFCAGAYAALPGLPSQRGIAPTVFEGNPTCSDIIDHPDVVEYKVDDPFSGVFGDGQLSVEYTVNQGALGPTFDWKAKGGVVLGIVSKGGPFGNFYKYSGTGYKWDNILHSPVNENNDRYYGLSHISVCYLPGEPSIKTTKTCDEQTVDLAGSTTISRVLIENDGDFDLSFVKARETSVTSQCTVLTVNGVEVNQPIPGGQDIEIEGAGALSVGQLVDIEVSCFYPGEYNVPNEVAVRGEYEGEVVTDTDSSNPDAECRVEPDPMVRIDKECERTRLQQEIGESGYPVLVVEACPSIIVENTGAGAFFNTLEKVVVIDSNVPELAGGVDVGPLAPGEFVDVAAFLGLDNLCYQPTAPQQPQNGDQDGIKFDTTGASFLNTAKVIAETLEGYAADSSDPAVCPLCDCPEGEDCPDGPVIQ